MATFQRGNRAAASKLNGEQVFEIRRLYDLGWSQGRLARESYDLFGVSISVGQIGRIVRRESWKGQAEPYHTMLPPDQVDMDAASARFAERVKALGPLNPMINPPIEEEGSSRVLDKLVEDINKAKTSVLDDLLKDDKGDSNDG